MVLAVVVAACGGSDGGQGSPAPSTRPVLTTDAPATTAPAPATSGSTTSSTSPAPPSTSIPAPTTTPATSTTETPATTPTTTSSTTTSVVCPPIGDRDDRQSGFPGSLSSLVGVDIRTGAHPCFDRVVIEFAPGDAPTPAIVPGYWVRYTDGPITLGQTDDQFVELRGDADLLITVESWMYEVDAAGRPIGYAGAIDLFPTNVETIEEIRLIDNWEGVQVWAIGLDRERDLRVTVLDDPVRLVVDLGA